MPELITKETVRALEVGSQGSTAATPAAACPSCASPPVQPFCFWRTTLQPLRGFCPHLVKYMQTTLR